jgi:hypothetical protein
MTARVALETALPVVKAVVIRIAAMPAVIAIKSVLVTFAEIVAAKPAEVATALDVEAMPAAVAAMPAAVANVNIGVAVPEEIAALPGRIAGGRVVIIHPAISGSHGRELRSVRVDQPPQRSEARDALSLRVARLLIHAVKVERHAVIHDLGRAIGALESPDHRRVRSAAHGRCLPALDE